MPSDVFCDIKKFKGAIVYEDDFFYVGLQSPAPLAEYHLLLVTKPHVECFGALPYELLYAFVDLKNRCQNALTEVCTSPEIFEHGIVGQTIPHAHLHLVAPSISGLDEVKLDYPDFKKVTEISDVANAFQLDGKYIYYETAKGDKYIFNPKDRQVQPQYLRIVMAKVNGYPERANWKEWVAAHGEDNVQPQALKLAPYFVK